MDINVFLFLTLFPFGQIIKYKIINPIDIVVGLTALHTIIKGYKYPDYFRYFIYYLRLALFSWICYALIFSQASVFIGLLYLLRLAAYFYFAVYIYEKYKTKIKKELILNALSFIGISLSFFGWIQYFFFSDLRALAEYGWDDHLFRLVGAFLDPTYTSIILVLSAILLFLRKKYFWAGFQAVTLVFTYSRAGFLALAVSLLFLLLKKVEHRKVLIVLTVFFLTFLFLPRDRSGEGVNLARTFSINERINNYQETFKIFKTSPALGIGFNNLCIARERILNDKNLTSHSCTGSDSSILFILATTGVVGLMLLIKFVSVVPANILLTTSFLAIFTHSFFANTFFYPFVLGWMAILLGLGSEVEGKT